MGIDATIHLAGPDGVRSMSIADFYALDGMTRNVLKAGELSLMSASQRSPMT